ncbi:Protein of unknown function [Belliella buryatensis]|uniref:DUF4199 domain-containing protein n=1 Tax=Belliella buryatensis TaxID=1500549 RepID=A0A239GEY9_9BACT|nr:DUF4199 domain-containing protein [Belliella buryatensis]SNS67043.1 Protein of unknown function [Belliella buryatensis]
METTQTPLKAGLNSGVILGIVSVIITFIFYFVSPEQLVGTAYTVIYFGALIGLVIYFGLQYRKSIGGYLEFGPAFNFSFISMLIGGLIGLAGTMILYFVVDPSLPNVIAESALETSMNMMEKFGVADNLTSEQIDEMRKATYDSVSPFGLIKSQGFALIGYAILSLIIGAIIKKRDKSLDY